MKLFSKKGLLILSLVSLFQLPIIGLAQSIDHDEVLVSKDERLFDSEEILKITLTGKMNVLLNDQSDNPIYYPLELSYTDNEDVEYIIPIESKTRGNFRRLIGGCYYLPLMLKFLPTDNPNGIFSKQKKMKLVMPCREEEYVYQEWLVYKIYNLINPEKSFKTRLVRIDLTDEVNDYYSIDILGILLEEERQLGRRNEMVNIERMLRPEHTDRSTFLEMAVFQYLIGNTDWSTQFGQNIKFIAHDSDSLPFTVPYDFDHAGIVNAPYALPPKDLNLMSVKERVYRGFCTKNMNEFKPVIEKFNKAKKEIYKLYTESDYLGKNYIKSTVKYLDAFYKVINNQKKWKRVFSYPCDPRGTGNIVIRGLEDD